MRALFDSLGVLPRPTAELVPTEAGLPAPSNSSFDRASGVIYGDSAKDPPALSRAELERLTAWVGPARAAEFSYVLPALSRPRRVLLRAEVWLHRIAGL